MGEVTITIILKGNEQMQRRSGEAEWYILRKTIYIVFAPSLSKKKKKKYIQHYSICNVVVFLCVSDFLFVCFLWPDQTITPCQGQNMSASLSQSDTNTISKHSIVYYSRYSINLSCGISFKCMFWNKKPSKLKIKQQNGNRPRGQMEDRP